MRKVIILLLLFIPFGALFADDPGEPRIRATVNPGSATIGQVLEYQVSIAREGLGALEILLPKEREFYPAREISAKKESAGKQDEKDKTEEPGKEVPLYIIHSAKKDDKSQNDMTYITVSMEISFYRPGTYALPEIEILDAEKIRIGYKIPDVEIRPTSQEAGLREIEPPLDLGGNYTRLILIVLGTIGLTLGAFFLYRYIKKLREERAMAPVIIPPIVIFMDDIHRFGGRALIVQGKIEEYVVGISMIFRKLLSGLLRIDATEMTSEEINRSLKKLLPKEIVSRYGDDITDFFGLWDLSKFAEFTPSEEILLANLESAIKLAKNFSDDLSGGSHVNN